MILTQLGESFGAIYLLYMRLVILNSIKRAYGLVDDLLRVSPSLFLFLNLSLRISSSERSNDSVISILGVGRLLCL